MGTVVGGRTHLRLRLLHSGALYGLSASCRSGSDSLPVASKWKGSIKSQRSGAGSFGSLE